MQFDLKNEVDYSTSLYENGSFYKLKWNARAFRADRHYLGLLTQFSYDLNT